MGTIVDLNRNLIPRISDKKKRQLISRVSDKKLVQVDIVFYYDVPANDRQPEVLAFKVGVDKRFNSKSLTIFPVGSNCKSLRAISNI